MDNKWDSPLSAHSGAAIAITIRVCGSTWMTWHFLKPSQPIPTVGEFISSFLDSEVQIQDQHNGRLVRICTIMELALQRIRAAGLEPTTKPGPMSLELKCAEEIRAAGHDPRPFPNNPDICQECGCHLGNHDLSNWKRP